MVLPETDPIPKNPLVTGLKLLVVPALSEENKEPNTKSVTVDNFCDLQKLKRHVSRIYSVALTDMTLYFQNQEGPHSQRLRILDDDYSLKHQGVASGATIVCQVAAWERPTSKLGESTYYMWAAEQKQVPDAIRVQKCGAPVQLEVAEEVTELASTVPRRIIHKYSWSDESRRTVKIYISVEGEAAAVHAAGREDDSRLKAEFGEQSLTVTIAGRGSTHVLMIDQLEHKIIPEECKTKIVPGKRITITLTKAKVDSLWNTLVCKN